MPNHSTTMADRVAQIRNRIDQACARSGRDPSEVTLLPVSKTFDVAAIREAIDLGFTRFGRIAPKKSHKKRRF